MVDPKQFPDFYNYINTDTNPHIHLLQLGWEKCKPKYTYTEYRDMYLIHFIRSGSGTFTIDKKVYPQQKGSIILTRPNQITLFSADKEDPWEYYWFAFSGTFAEDLIERTFFRDQGFEYHLDDDSLCTLIVESAVELEKAENQEIYGLIVLFRLLDWLISRSKHTDAHAGAKPGERSYNAYTHKAQEYIHLNYNKHIQTGDIARALNIDRTYFYRIFKADTGLSPEEYLINFRIQKAKQFLSETQFPVSTVAQYIGYSYASFYSIFCKKVHTTPSQYRLYAQERGNQVGEKRRKETV